MPRTPLACSGRPGQLAYGERIGYSKDGHFVVEYFSPKWELGDEFVGAGRRGGRIFLKDIYVQQSERNERPNPLKARRM